MPHDCAIQRDFYLKLPLHALDQIIKYYDEALITLSKFAVKPKV